MKHLLTYLYELGSFSKIRRTRHKSPALPESGIQNFNNLELYHFNYIILDKQIIFYVLTGFYRQNILGETLM